VIENSTDDEQEEVRDVRSQRNRQPPQRLTYLDPGNPAYLRPICSEVANQFYPMLPYLPPMPPYLPPMSPYLPPMPPYVPPMTPYLPPVPPYLPSMSPYLPPMSPYLPSMPPYLPSMPPYLPPMTPYVPPMPPVVPTPNEAQLFGSVPLKWLPIPCHPYTCPTVMPPSWQNPPFPYPIQSY
jgi:hypothetical protein